MVYPGKLVPQADSLAVVTAVVENIAAGKHSDEDIVPPGYTDRQGRYYRAAAEDLGLVQLTGPNYAELTTRGQDYARANATVRNQMLRELVITQNPFMRELLDYISGSQAGRSRAEIVEFIEDRTDLSGQTPRRRFATVRAWLTEVGLAGDVNGRVVASGAAPGFGSAEVDASASILEGIPDVFEPETVPEAPVDLEPNVVKKFVDVAKIERANGAHEHLRARVANNAGLAGYSTRPNGYIDVCAVKKDRVVIFEVKSAKETNFASQIRHAVAQLYQYRWIQRLPGADLCIVIEIPPPDPLDWTVDYLYDDRAISLIYQDHGFLVEPPGREGPMSHFVD